MRVKDEDDTWLVLTSWGRRGFFESQGFLWAFDGSLNLPPRDTAADFDFVQLARDSFQTNLSFQHLSSKPILLTTNRHANQFLVIQTGMQADAKPKR